MDFQRVAILGVGLLGGSLGAALKAKGSRASIIGYGHREETVRRAKELGFFDETTTNLRQAVSGADLVILCTPVGLFESILREISPWVDPSAIVTDVGSTKRSVVELGETLLAGQGGRGAKFVGSHPMAGSEKKGVEHARADLYDGALCITTPTPKTDKRALDRVESVWRFLGMRLTQIDPTTHDRALAEVSHLPHAISCLLMSLPDKEAIALAGKGFWDLTRLAGGDGALWRDIFLDNRDNVRTSLEQFRSQIDLLLNLLNPDQSEALKNWLDGNAQKRNALLPKKNTGAE